MYFKLNNNNVTVSELSNSGIMTSKEKVNFNINSGCAGLAFSSKEPVFEPFAQSSQVVSKEELDFNITGTVVQTIIAIPLFNETGNTVGVAEIINCDKTIFSASNTKNNLKKFSKYISLLFYTNGLLKVITMNNLEYFREL